MRPNGRFVFWAIWAAFAFGFLLCRWTLFDKVFYNIDEAEYAVAAQGLRDNMLPGLDLVGSTKPPGIVFLYSSIFAVAGDSILALQVAGFVLWLVLLALIMKLSVRLLPDIPIWMPALSFFLLANSFGPPRDMHALNVELPGIVLAIGSLLLVTSSHAFRRLIIAGLLLGLAVMFRQSLVLFAVVAGLLMAPLNRKAVVPYVIGMCSPWLILVAIYAGRGGLAWAYDSWVRYPLLYSSDTGWLGFLEAAYYVTMGILLQAIVPMLFAIVGVYFAVNTKQRPIIVLTVVSILAVAAGSRFFEHYYIQGLPALALLCSLTIYELVRKGVYLERAVKAWLAFGAVLALMHFPFWRYWDDTAPPRGISAESLDLRGLEVELAQFATEQTTPGQRVFVWGYCPQIYFHANRLPGARDFLCHYTTGYSTATMNPRSAARPDAEQMLFDDLKRNRPTLIFDISFVDFYQYSFQNFPITKFPALAEYIKANYRPAAQVGQVPVYRLAIK